MIVEPNRVNGFHWEHVRLLRQSYHALTGRNLVAADLSDLAAAAEVYFAPFVVLSHDTSADPIFNYANRKALTLFEMSWEEMTSLASRMSAELPNQAERASNLERVRKNGYIDNYAGIRIAKSGKRFRIEAVVWNLTDQAGDYRGQAATFAHWYRI
jgi:hypothetical protein